MLRMKKIIWPVCIFLAALLLIPDVINGETPGRRMTLMVYMCGSNLESSNGSASEDIREMMDSVPPGEEVSVLVMTGGSKVGNTSAFFRETAVEIHEIISGKPRMVWESDELMDMGYYSALSKLLDFGQKYYPAQEYALIIWDHGGGPLGGICWDELFSMDSMELDELSNGLASADFPEKLSWIGFDACLMGTAEVAAAVAPYARYMIASQETEPASGWDYSFLEGLAGDENGAATGIRIVDSYFASLEESQDILTLSCIDLEKIGPLAVSMEGFFSSFTDKIDEESFKRISLLRMETSGFGKVNRSTGDNGYDLVDLADLVEQYSGYDDSAAEVLRSVEDAVVYSRSNREGVNGISVYHPYKNKAQYNSQWKKEYYKLGFTEGYKKYIDRFAAFLLEETVADWSGLNTQNPVCDENGIYHFSLQLTPEQQANYASAQLVVMKEFSSIAVLNDLTLIATEKACMTEDGILTAEYDNQLLYVTDDQDKVLLGPVSYSLDETDDTIQIYGGYLNSAGDMNAEPMVPVCFYCRPAEDDPRRMEIVHTYVRDKATGHYTNRLAVSEDGYTEVVFAEKSGILPGTDGVIPEFSLWEAGNSPLYGIALPCSWHFQMVDNLQPSRLSAMFQITDNRQNTCSSIPAAIESGKEKRYSLTPDTFETDECSIKITSFSNEDDPSRGLNFDFEVANKTDCEYRLAVRQIVINNGISVSKEVQFYPSLPAGGRRVYTCLLDGKDLAGTGEIRRVDFILDLYETGRTIAVPVSFAMEGCNVSAWAKQSGEEDGPFIAAYEEDGIIFRLVSLRQGRNGRIEGMLHVINQTDTFFSGYGPLCLNGYHTRGYLSMTVQPHTDSYVPFSDENSVGLLPVLTVQDSGINLVSVDHIMETLGIRAINRIDYFPDFLSLSQRNPRRVSILLPEPFELQEGGAGKHVQKPLTTGAVSVGLAGVFVADDGIALAVTGKNDRSEAIRADFTNLYLNGKPAHTHPLRGDMLIPPESQMAEFIVIQTDAPLREKTKLNRLECSIETGDGECRLVEILFPEGTALSTAARGTWLAAEETVIQYREPSLTESDQ